MKGFCVTCKTLYEWEGKPAVVDARCPRCGMNLAQARARILAKYEPTHERPIRKGAA